VLVIGNDPESQLAPFQENNEGTCPEEYLEFHDTETEEREKYETGKVEKVVMPDGRLLNPWDDEFRVEGSIGLGGDTHKVPKELKKRNVPFTEIYETFEEYMKDWCGEQERDSKMGKYGYWENSNAKWDWYELGGRWCGFFKLKSPNMKKNVGKSGVFGNEPRHDSDQAYKRQIDFEGMMDASGKKAADRYDRVANLFGGTIPKLEINWKKDMFDGGKYDELDIEEKRKLFNEQPVMKKIAAMREKIWDDRNNPDRELIIGLDWKFEDYQVSREEYIQRARSNAISTFAVLKDGKWYERGSMGWWGCVSNEKNEDEWINQFSTLIDSLPDDTLLSIYDAHI
jgi:hypothetical protein